MWVAVIAAVILYMLVPAVELTRRGVWGFSFRGEIHDCFGSVRLRPYAFVGLWWVDCLEQHRCLVFICHAKTRVAAQQHCQWPPVIAQNQVSVLEFLTILPARLSIPQR